MSWCVGHRLFCTTNAACTVQKLVVARNTHDRLHKNRVSHLSLAHKISRSIHPMSPYSSSTVLTGTTDESTSTASRRTSDSDNYEEYNNEESPSVETSEQSSGTTNISSSGFGGADGSSSTEDQQLFFITSYSNFDKLAHGPRGNTAKHTLRTYKFYDDGSLVLLHIAGDGESVLNPAFSRFHPR
jgi:hypothetical protein